MGDQATVTFASGAQIWTPGAEVRPLRVLSGVLLYLLPPVIEGREPTPLGLVRPEQFALPCPVDPDAARARWELRAVTPAVVQPVDPAVDAEELHRAAPRQELFQAWAEMASWRNGLIVPERAARLLLFLQEHGAPDGWIRMTQFTLALVVGRRRESLNTTLNGWRNEDWIELRYRKMRVRNAAALRRVAGLPAPEESEAVHG